MANLLSSPVVSLTEEHNESSVLEEEPIVIPEDPLSTQKKPEKLNETVWNATAEPGDSTSQTSAKKRVAGKDEDYEDPELDNSIARALNLADQYRLINFKDLPEPWRINRFILRGYVFTKSKRNTAMSILRLSNETFNIWSHLLGVFLIAAFPLFLSPLSSFRGSGGDLDLWVAGIYFGAGAGCMLCSAVWHTGKCVSDAHIMTSFASVDMMGISLVLTASLGLVEYLAFYTEPFWQRTYMSLTSIGGIVGLILPWTSLFRRHDLALIKLDISWIPITRAWIRVIYFVAIGAQGVFIPMLHLMYTKGIGSTVEFYSYLLPIYSPIVVGAAIYATRFPEAWFPGRFDYIGASHNLWHIAVLIGIFRGCTAIIGMYELAWERARVASTF